MIQVDELICFGDMADDIEFADGFLFRGLAGYSGGRIAFAIKRVFRPLPDRGQIFERVVVFDEDVQD